jgi:L-2-hydroxycarboxylate dehydrogenase (NAD+)
MTPRDDRLAVAAADLKAFVGACMEGVGVAPEDAEIVADVLVAADLRGVESHGVARLRRYVEGVRGGRIRAERALTVVRDGPATALLDAGNGLGQPAAVIAMRSAVAKARDAGVGVVAVRRTNHFGIAGYYPGIALAAGMAGFAASNASPQVAPTFGSEPMYGTNPIAIGLPTDPRRPFLLDMATAVVPRGKLERLRREGGTVPVGWAIDQGGEPMTRLDELVDGLVARRGYSLLPLGGQGERLSGHKGFGLGLLVDLLCGPLAGAAWGRHVYGPEGAGLGHCFAALRIDSFRPPAEFVAAATALEAEIRGARKLPGEDRIYVPGEKEAVEAERRLATGIPLHAAVVAELREVGAQAGRSFDRECPPQR